MSDVPPSQIDSHLGSGASTSGGHGCPICGRVYGRMEHLARHYLTHTSVYPFACALCGKSFRRNDVLKRHQRKCNPGAKTLSLVSMSRRASTVRRKACQHCVRQKRRCDLEWPCNTCTLQRKACEYLDTDQLSNAKQKASGEESEICRRPELAASRSSLDDLPAELESSHGNMTYPSSSPNAASLHAEGQMGAWSPTTPSPIRDVLAASREDYFRSPGLPVYQFLRTPARPPAETLSFLANFTKDMGIVFVFESDAILLTLKDTCRTLLGDRNYPLDHDLESLDQPNIDIVFDFPEIDLNHSPIFNPQDLDTVSFPLDAGIRRTQVTPESISRHSLHYVPDERHDDELLAKTTEIVYAIKTSAKPDDFGSTNQLSWSAVLEAMCLRFFSPNKLRIFLEAYWAIWSPNCPFIHRPTFNPLSVPTQLLAAMVVMGASHSPNPTDRNNARQWYDWVEAMVFDRPYLSCSIANNSGHRPRSSADSRSTAQALQAAFIMCVCQNWDGTLSAKQRIRRERFKSLVTTYRNLAQCHVKHEDLSLLTLQNFNWRKFIETEEMIRILLWVYLLDTAFVVFNNTPPQLALREISIGLASSEGCFQAGSSSACLDQIQRSVARAGKARSPSMYSLIGRFCSHEMDQDEIDHVAHEGFINLWCVVCAFHSMIFNLYPLAANGHSFQSIQRGLTNWKLVWNRRLLNGDERYFDVPVTEQQHQQTPSDESGMWRRPGFWRHASEFWLLAQLYVDRPSLSFNHDDVADCYDDVSMTRIKSLIAKFSGLDPANQLSSL